MGECKKSLCSNFDGHCFRGVAVCQFKPIDDLPTGKYRTSSGVYTMPEDVAEKINRLRAELKSLALGIVENCKLCRVHGIGMDSQNCVLCLTKKRESEARAIAKREGWEI